MTCRSLCTLLVLLLLVETAQAADTVFLRDGRVLQVEKVEETGDTVRITPFAGNSVDLPHREVLSIHHDQPPPSQPASPLPAKVYEGLVKEMLENIRREAEQGRSSWGPLPTGRR